MLRWSFVVLGFVSAGPALASDLYVDGANGQASASGSLFSPFRFVWQAMRAAQPGDTIHLLPTATYAQVAFQKSGVPGAPIHLVGDGAAPNQTKVTGGGSNFGVWIDADWVSVSNLDVTAPGDWAGIYVNGGRHHVAIFSNTVHDAGGDGISTYNADYVLISWNVVHGNAGYTASGVFGSGISLFESKDTDGAAGIRMIVQDNLVYGNANTPRCASGCTDSDGSGIIVDDGRHAQSDGVPYTGQTLIANNVAFGNGGRGVHVSQSDHVLVRQNTTYFNNQDPYEGSYRPGEVMVDDGDDVLIQGNILYTDGGQGIGGGRDTGAHVGISAEHCTSGAAGVTATGNLIYGPAGQPALMSFAAANSAPVGFSGNVWADPRYDSPSLDPARAYFDVQPGSPAYTASGKAGAYP